MYALGDWGVCDTAGRCQDNVLKVTVGGQHIVDLELFEKGEGAVPKGTNHGIDWSRHLLAPGILHIEMIVPSNFFDASDLEIEVDLNVGNGDADYSVGIGVGIDDIRVTTYALDCPTPIPEGRRNLREYMESPKFVPRKYKSRKLFVDVETDECTCICPALPGGTTGPLMGPRTMNLYYRQDAVTCDPTSESIGTVTMTPKSDGTIEYKYDVDAKYELVETNLYVGPERLPFNEQTGTYYPPEEFPYTGSAGGVTEPIVTDPVSCDFYMSAHAYVSNTDEPFLIDIVITDFGLFLHTGMRRFPHSGSHYSNT